MLKETQTIYERKRYSGCVIIDIVKLYTVIVISNSLKRYFEIKSMYKTPTSVLMYITVVHFNFLLKEYCTTYRTHFCLVSKGGYQIYFFTRKLEI